MSLRYAILGLLADSPKSGYELTKAFDRSLGHVWSARHSQIYPELARLKEMELIRQVEEGPRGRKTYAITEDGLHEFRHWMTETEPDYSARDAAFLRVFFLWLVEPEDAVDYLSRLADRYRANLATYEGYASEGPPTNDAQRAFRIALEAGLRHERTMLEWAEWATAEIKSTTKRRRTMKAI